MPHHLPSSKKSPRASSRFIAVEVAAVALACVAVGATSGASDAQSEAPPVVQERGPTVTSAADIAAAIGQLADIDYPTRVKAARLVRRSAAAQAVPALVQATNSHKDGFVRFRSLILLTGFNDPRAREQMLKAMTSPNDRLREVAYGYFELHPDRTLIPRFVSALQKEMGDFVRPAIVRALAAVGDDPAAREALLAQIARGIDFHRSTVIEALGDYERAYALPKLLDVVKLDGPLQDDAAVAIGRIGDKQSLGVLAALQRSGSKELQPTLAAAICMLGVNCPSHLSYLDKVIAFADDNPGYQELVRPAAAGLAAAAIGGNADALAVLFDRGLPSMDPIRAPMALAVAKVALRNTTLTLGALQKQKDLSGALVLLAEGFDMLEEDLEEEQFFVAVRKEYWTAADAAPVRKLAEQLITKLDF